MPYDKQKSKKRKSVHDEGDGAAPTQRPQRLIPSAREGRPWTLSVAVASSFMETAQTPMAALTAVGRLSRALAIFCVDEVVVFDDGSQRSASSAAGGDGDEEKKNGARRQQQHGGDEDRYTGDVDPGGFAAHVLSYLEAPPFMRKALFPLHANLRHANMLLSLEMPHHPHPAERLPYREGVTLDKRPEGGEGTLVDIGLKEVVTLTDTAIPPKTRVTLALSSPNDVRSASAVDPAEPRVEGGFYWGFAVRRCGSLSGVFTEAPFEGGYDVTIGTSERGVPVSQAFPQLFTRGGPARGDDDDDDMDEADPHGTPRSDGPPKPPARLLDFRHLVVVFGGRRGLEFAAEQDGELARMGIRAARARELFDHWVDVLPNQGARSIQTDEAVFIALTALRRLWDSS